MKVRILIGALMALGLVGLPAQAGHTPDAGGCPIHVTDASATNPNLVDGINDWNGELGVSRGGAPYGDVFREGTDITAAWLTRDVGGAYHANVQIADLAAVQQNVVVYMLWTFPQQPSETPPPPPATSKDRRWVSARLNAVPGNEFTYGYLSAGTATAQQFYTDGVTTGSIVSGPSGIVTIDIPMATMGNPPVGETLAGVAAETRVLLGSPVPLPPPSPVRHGLVGVADDTTDSLTTCDAYVN